ncbi:GL11946 [Drosophila persimilis]|uniref:GL11946 n=1 Tax=Drosophila persimilis TaxID=7234 RepID=B4GLZ4_DROPE|nr:GL11946 [Drosophila persimilis]
MNHPPARERQEAMSIASGMTRKSLKMIRCIISGEDEDEDPQLKSVQRVYDMIT